MGVDVTPRRNTLAAAYLGVGFAWVSFVAIVVEPDMGFTTFADFFDGQKVAEGYTSNVWLVSNFLYLTFPIAVLVIVNSGNDRLLQWAGVSSALLWLLVGAVDRVGIQLHMLLPTNEAVITAVAATLPIRFALLKSAVLSLGVVAWRTTRGGTASGVGARLWAALGWIVLLLSLGLMFVFTPAPVAFSIWGFALAVSHFRARRGEAASR